MPKFSFHAKNDSLQEAFGVVNLATEREALEYFAQLKQLPVETFNEMYNVKRHDHEFGNSKNITTDSSSEDSNQEEATA